MKLRPVVVISIFLIALALFGISLPAQAAPAPQGIQFATNTPLPNGNIMYQVQEGDSCIRVALLHGITVEQLRQNNTNLNANCDLTSGQLLLIGTGGPLAVSATPGPSPTPLPPTVTPTPVAGTTEICVLLFNDINGDGIRQLTETVIEGGAISVTETNGKFSRTFQTAINPDPNAAYAGTCLSDVPEGNYQIGAALPDNYNPTTDLNYTLEVKAGDIAVVDFGAQSKESTVQQPATNNGGGTSPWLGFFGGLLLLGGLGLGWYALRLRKPKSRLQQSGLLRK